MWNHMKCCLGYKQEAANLIDQTKQDVHSYWDERFIIFDLIMPTLQIGDQSHARTHGESQSH